GSTTNTLKHLEREHGLIRPEISTKFMQNMSDDCEYDDEYIPPIDDHDLLTELESYNDEQGEE
ncbi:13874_t:CDS:2, partial [Entrophospora sp. SA101]